LYCAIIYHSFHALTTLFNDSHNWLVNGMLI
jgi:hypothetical protein